MSVRDALRTQLGPRLRSELGPILLQKSALHRLSDGLGVAVVVLLPFAEGLHVLCRDQPNVMTKGRESATDVVCSRAGFDPHQTRLKVGHVPLKSPTRQLLATAHFTTRINSDEVKATLAAIHSDRS